MEHSIKKDPNLYRLLVGNITSAIGVGITGIAIPWTLIKNYDQGEQILGYTMIFTTLFLFLMSPFIGVWIDKFSRKRFLIAIEVIGLVLTGICCIYGFFHHTLLIWQIILLQFLGSLYYATHIPARIAFVQELFDGSQFKYLNSILETQSQVASMLSAALASFLIERVSLNTILIIDFFTYLICIASLALIPYSFVARSHTKEITFLADLYEGFQYITKNKIIILFFLFSTMPFISVLVGNYINPIYVASVLQENAEVLGFSNIMYTIGAIVIGVTVSFMMNKIGSYKTVILTSFIYLIGTILTLVFPVTAIFLWAQILRGAGNSGTKVASNTIMMQLVPKSHIGRVNSFFSSISLLIRLCLLSLFTPLIASIGASYAIAIITLLLIVAFFGLFLCRSVSSNKLHSESKLNAS
ncbi:MFS transporter [Paenibacillus hunanensis]|uniref:MFS transporter n=1 Tax=Paenibacillus hunanensis TaxID=539262 RepID=UPI002A6B1938|nr:MFS transporter [Paenibacillus hunanensis]WPP42405.1 MFS transporter [Paenibacillus hunanensis]